MRRIIVFGTGRFFQKMEKELRQKYEIAAFLDNKILSGEKAYYKESSEIIYNPADVKALETCPILIMTRQFIDNCVQLLQLGVDGERILFGVSLFPQNVREGMAFDNGNALKIEDGKIVFQTVNGKKYKIEKTEDYNNVLTEYVRENGREKYPMVGMISSMPLTPASRLFGSERGKPVDRYYIEKFLETHKGCIKGDTLEIAETAYSVKYGEDRIKNAYMLHVEGWGENAIKGNLETGEGIEENRFDTAIITQTLMFIYDIQSAAQNIYKMLKPGGTALVTVAGISQVSRYDADNWGSYYSFHEEAVRRMFEPLFGRDKVETVSYGNVKTAISLLYGLCCEDLAESDFETGDPDYPLIIGAVLHK